MRAKLVWVAMALALFGLISPAFGQIEPKAALRVDSVPTGRPNQGFRHG